MLIDTHIHVGQFFDLYFAPSYIHQLMEQLSVSHYAVSSTTICEENYCKVLDELHELIDLDSERVLPVMWITPHGLEGDIAWFLESDIPWRMIKIHPFLNSEIWQKNPGLLAEVVEIAKELNLPMLIHTGNEECCHAGLFERIIAENPEVYFILAHGRPLDQAVRLARTYNNVFVDSAFMPVDHMSCFISEGLDRQLLWGTDMCIPHYFYPEENLVQYYINKLESFRAICSKEQFHNITVENALRLFYLKVAE